MSLFDKLKNWSTRITRIPAFPAITLAILCIITYFPTLQNEFKLDDFIYLDKALYPSYTSIFDLFSRSDNQHYNPINILLNTFLFKLWGKNVVPFHLFNMLLFFINCQLIYQMTFLFFKKKSSALLAAVLFCIHPLNAEIINQIVFNTVLFCALCFQLTLLQYDQFLLTRQKLNYINALCCALLAAFSLEISWVLPGYLFLWAVLFRKMKIQSAIRETIPFWVISLTVFVVWQMVNQGNSLSGDFAQKISYLKMNMITFWGTLIALSSWYIQKIVYPMDAIWIYATPPLNQAQALIIICFLTVCILCLFLIRQKIFTNPTFFFLIVWFLTGFIFLPLGSLAHPEIGLLIEPYWFYISSMGIFMISGLICGKLRDKISRVFFVILLTLVGSFLFFQTQFINTVTKTEKSYSEYWMSISPNPVPLSALSKIASHEQDYSRAIEYYKIYLEKFTFSPYSVHRPEEVFTTIASLYSDQGDLQNAKFWVEKARLSNPRDPRPYIVLGSVSVREKNLTKAEEYLLKAIAVSPGNKLAKLNLADLYLMDQKEKLAIPLLIQLTNSHLIRNEKVNVFAKLAALQYLYVSKDEAQSTINQLLSQEPEPQSYLILAEALSYFHLPEQSNTIIRLGLGQYPHDKELITYSGQFAQ